MELRRGDFTRAAALCRPSLVQGWDSQDPQQNVHPLKHLTRLASETGHEKVAHGLFAFAQQIEELPDGNAWLFPGDGRWHEQLLDFVIAERRCCGFFRIELIFEPSLGPVTLNLRGPEGTKAFITKTFVA